MTGIDEDRGEELDATNVLGEKGIEDGGINIPDTDDDIIVDEGNDEFGPGCRVAGNVTGKGIDITDSQGSATINGGPTHALAKTDVGAGDLTLEGPEGEGQGGGGIPDVEASPVDVPILSEFARGKGVVEMGGSVGQVGDPEALASEKGFEFLGQVRISGLEIG